MGISFSALEFEIKAPGADAALKALAEIDQKAQATAKKVAQTVTKATTDTTAAVQQAAANTQAIDAAAAKTAKVATAAVDVAAAATSTTRSVAAASAAAADSVTATAAKAQTALNAITGQWDRQQAQIKGGFRTLVDSVPDAEFRRRLAALSPPKDAAPAVDALEREINQSLRALEQLAKQLDITDREAVQTFRDAAAAERQWLTTSKANTDQHARLTQIVQRVDQQMQRAGPNFTRAANASVTLASGVESLARTGNVAGEGLKQVITQGSNIAFMFGTAGPIVGAIGILGVAMFNFWGRRAREVRDARIQMLSELETLIAGTDLVGAARQQQHLFSGNSAALRKPGESDAAFRARSGGLQAVRPRLAELERQLPQRTLEQLNSENPLTRAMAENMLRSPLVKEYAELRRLAAQMETDYATTTEVVNRLTDAENQRAQTLQRIAADERAAADALKDANAERQRALQLAQEGLRLGSSGRSGLTLSTTTAGVDAAANRMVRDAFGGPEANNQFGAIKLPKPKSAADLIAATGVGKLALEALAAMDLMALDLENGVTQSIGDAIYNGFAAGFSGEGLDGVFAAFGQTVLAGIGGVLTQMGMVYLEYGALMSGLASLLPNPFTAGPAGLAIGAALIAMGAALGAVASGGGRGGRAGGRAASGGGITQIIDRGIINPVAAPRASGAPITPRESVTYNTWVIGENDARAQSTLVRMYDKGKKRGTL